MFPAVENDILGDNYTEQQEKSAGRQLNADGMVEKVRDQTSKRRTIASEIVPQAGYCERCPEPFRYQEGELDSNRTEAGDHTKQSDFDHAFHHDSADSVGLKFEKAIILPLNHRLILNVRAPVTLERDGGKAIRGHADCVRAPGCAPWVQPGREWA